MLFLRIIKTIILFSAMVLGCITNAFADYQLNMNPGVTPISQDIYHLHMTIFWICVAIGGVVFGVLFYSLYKHRKSVGHKAATFHGNTRIEVFWAIVPFLILVIMAIPATLVLMRMEDNAKAVINIKVTGYQWKWQYEYLDNDISFFSNLATPIQQINNQAPKDKWYLLEVDKPLVVPINKKIRFLVTANDVIHSWWVPALGIKRDAIPGFIREAWARIEKPGIYRGQCAELCGINHAYMPIVVDARTEEAYQKWLKEQTTTATQHTAQNVAQAPAKIWTLSELMDEGQKVYDRQCVSCHKPDGAGMPPAFPAIKGSTVATGPMSNHLDVVLKGRPGTAMAAFAPQLNDLDIAAVVTYQRNSWGNANTNTYGPNAGGTVQPSDVAEARKK